MCTNGNPHARSAETSEQASNCLVKIATEFIDPSVDVPFVRRVADVSYILEQAVQVLVQRHGSNAVRLSESTTSLAVLEFRCAMAYEVTGTYQDNTIVQIHSPD